MSRVTLEEKRVRMLEIFHESLDVFELKQLESIAPKQKGIVAGSVKTVLQGLVDDGLIETDKDGGLVYFWSFPGNTIGRLQGRVRAKESRLEQLRARAEELKKRQAELSQSEEKGEQEERLEKLRSLKELRPQVTALQAEVEQLRQSDPAACEEAKAAANRWADNIYGTVSWLRDRFGVEEALIRKQYGIAEELEYFQ